MTKAVYYGAEDLELHINELDEKPEFDKEDELLGHLKNRDVFQGEDGLTATREKVFNHVENDASDDIEEHRLKIT